MSRRALTFAVLVLGMLALSRLPADEVVLKDGSRVIGKVIDMAGGKLKVKTVFAKDVEIDWAEVVSLTTDEPHKIVQVDGTVLNGQAIRTAEGGIAVKTKELANPVPVTHDSITAINPPPALTFRGFLSAGATINDGNTRSRSAFASGEFEARAEKQRFNVRAIYNYSDDNDHEVTAKNGRLTASYDYFLSKRLYIFASALFEYDLFQDLNLRTALSAGPGYQIIDKGDFKSDWNKELELIGEVGISYFNEDYKHSPDQTYPAARWLFKLNWPVVPGKIVIFHRDEGYPGLERGDDLYILTEQGVRFSIWKNLFAGIQLNWRWDNTPAAGTGRSDTTVLFSIGYNFDSKA